MTYQGDFPQIAAYSMISRGSYKYSSWFSAFQFQFPDSLLYQENDQWFLLASEGETEIAMSQSES